MARLVRLSADVLLYMKFILSFIEKIPLCCIFAHLLKRIVHHLRFELRWTGLCGAKYFVMSQTFDPHQITYFHIPLELRGNLDW